MMHGAYNIRKKVEVTLVSINVSGTQVNTEKENCIFMYCEQKFVEGGVGGRLSYKLRRMCVALTGEATVHIREKYE